MSEIILTQAKYDEILERLRYLEKEGDVFCSQRTFMRSFMNSHGVVADVSF